MKKVLVTGAAGFIGFHLVKKLINLNYAVVGIDNLNDYYDVELKKDRLRVLGIDNVSKECKYSSKEHNFLFYKESIENNAEISKIFDEHQFDAVINLAAQAGVRYSIENPSVYAKSNLIGFFNLLENIRRHSVKHFIYASSSSVYGNSKSVPFSEANNEVNSPVSFYAATKRCNEIMAESYHHLYKIKMTGLRFFTVYGPWGRPDMAMFLFTDAMVKNNYIKVFNEGNLSRDFTYIDDIIQGLLKVIETSDNNKISHNIFNIGNNSPVKLLDFIEAIEDKMGIKAKKKYLPMQDGDVEQTWADTSKFREVFNFSSNTPVKKGVSNFVDWYKEYYRVE